MIELTRQQIYTGSSQPPPERRTLHAGPLTMLYEDGGLRHIRLGDTPVLHQIYAALRNHNWDTIPGTLQDQHIEQDADSFDVHYRMHHQQDEIDFVWQGHIQGSADGTVRFRFDGQAHSTFRRNRIGFCVLHPMTLAGQWCLIEHTDGEAEEGRFPELIAPHQPYFDIRAITHQAAPGVRLRVLMEGDTFEMEDQRNWTDASYKTYCTPLGLPFPVTVEAGTQITQQITLSLQGTPPRIETAEQAPRLHIRDEAVPLPSIGLGLPAHRQLPTTQEAARLRALNPGHLRGTVRFSLGESRGQLDYALDYAERIESPLELAVFVTDAAAEELPRLAGWLAAADRKPVRITVFHEQEKSTGRRWAELAREHLGSLGIPIGAGTDAFFTELNRERPPADLLDFVTYSLNPQVHVFDDLSLVETLPVQAATVETARSFSGSAGIVVGPVTFKIRWNPNATGAPPPVPPGELPPQVDPRQMSLFGAGWTLGSIKHLAGSGVQALTYYETVGWRGVMGTAQGSPLPEQFPSLPGMVFPMYQVFRAVNAFAGGQVVAARSTQPLRAEGLVLQRDNRHRILLANLAADEQTITLDGIQEPLVIRRLDATTAQATMHDPDALWNVQGERLPGNEVTLAPYALAIIDTTTEAGSTP